MKKTILVVNLFLLMVSSISKAAEDGSVVESVSKAFHCLQGQLDIFSKMTDQMSTQATIAQQKSSKAWDRIHSRNIARNIMATGYDSFSSQGSKYDPESITTAIGKSRAYQERALDFTDFSSRLTGLALKATALVLDLFNEKGIPAAYQPKPEYDAVEVEAKKYGYTLVELPSCDREIDVAKQAIAAKNQPQSQTVTDESALKTVPSTDITTKTNTSTASGKKIK
ncbi:MAG: hypothetical protein HY422_02090 [Candidatus Komeilibacteria bacterium]|nr:hypothetical protein [Candidatus Komeilibacteria bacterium]